VPENAKLQSLLAFLLWTITQHPCLLQVILFRPTLWEQLTGGHMQLCRMLMPSVMVCKHM
jgi:hypothetical protein